MDESRGSSHRCRGCGSTDTSLVLDFGDVPSSDFFPVGGVGRSDARWPLQWFACSTCRLVQLGPVGHVELEPPPTLESATARAHATTSVASVVAQEGLEPGQTVIEIDSHHGGSWLDGFRAAGLVERPPTATADLVVDVHGLAHEADVAAPLAAHAARLAPGAALVLEFHHLMPLVQQSQLDTVRHGHFSYFSLMAMRNLLGRQGLVVTRAITTEVYGGSLRVTARRASESHPINPTVEQVLTAERAAGLDSTDALLALGGRAKVLAADFRAHLEEAAAQGRVVAGYGAPSKAPVLVALAGVDAPLIAFTVDLSTAKQGARIPGTDIEIRAVKDLADRRPDEIVLFTWDIAAEILQQLGPDFVAHDWDPDVYVPLPTPGYVSGPRSGGGHDLFVRNRS